MNNSSGTQDNTIEKCQLSEDKETKCSGDLTVNKDKLFHIDGLILCPIHTREYYHQACSAFSYYQKKFAQLQGKMVFTQ